MPFPERRGHFLLESGYHADLWLSLDALFVDPAAIAPDVAALADLLRPHAVSAVCGPLLGGAFLAQAVATALGARFYFAEPAPPSSADLFSARYRVVPRATAAGERFAIVDDVISAGSSVRAVEADLRALGASLVVVGSLLVLGTKALDHFASSSLPVVSLARRPFNTWLAAECPLCREGAPLERPL